MTTRGERIAQKEAAKKRFKSYGVAKSGMPLNNWRHPKPCSCSMCCNARSSPLNKGKNKLTRREKIEELRYADQCY